MQTFNVLMPVRSICFVEDNTVLVGTMGDGCLHAYDLNNGETYWTDVLGETIPIIRYYKGVLMACTTDGALFIYDFDKQTKTFTRTFSGRLHHPTVATERFSTMGKFAEIWSCQFSPYSTKSIVTCSEDQTAQVWRFGKLDLNQYNSMEESEKSKLSGLLQIQKKNPESENFDSNEMLVLKNQTLEKHA